MTSQQRAAGDKRRAIQHAAVRVFAKKGFEAARVSDIAREAEVAYGLVYHYFGNKEDVLDSIVREHLGILENVVDSIDAQKLPVRDKLAGIASFMLDSSRVAGDIVRVLLLETRRSSLLAATPRAQAIEAVFARIERMLRSHQADGTLRADVDARMVSYVLLGALENLLTAFALGSLDPSEESFERAKAAVVEVVWGGLREPGGEVASASKPGST